MPQPVHGDDPAPTLAEVARRAGVSTATASRVLNRSARVSVDVAARVERAARELAYVRRRAARARGTGVVAVVVFADPSHYHADAFPVRLLAGLRRSLPGAERELAVFTVPRRSRRPPLVRYLCGGHVDGVLLVGPWGDSTLTRLLHAARVPVVSLGRPPEPGTVAFVDADNLTGARDAVRRLCASGRRAVATIAGPPDTSAGADRLAGYHQAMAAIATARPAVAYGDFSSASGEHAMQWLLDQRPELNAVFAASDQMAAGALRTLRRHGLRVPEDVALIGFDDAPLAARCRPALTTVRQPVEELGSRAMELVLRNPQRDESVVLPTRLVVRASG
ncbi:LacI family DNA-binding transcriptional regulator [Streptomyces sp. SP17BM10]|uniref:LacI family DNA-binding transcriptional regulator n=1 Tax=Streptomyces sp. SP17BM10 TaxID=3002530 RepID=UPI002E78164D|nr:LacI family DNA-binding transcriptional regulator [Streptomyces sp. SP17BM10]MEE1782790.1 LacI family DNA-binding transcriptional regulator [Streptomyces sp. SP17BM10]